MARCEIEVLSLASKFSGLYEYRRPHEDGIAHLIVKRHRFFHRTVCIKAEIGGLAHQLCVTRVPRALSQLRKYQMSRQCKGAGAAAKRILGAAQIWFRQLFNVGNLAHAHASDQSHTGKISHLIEIVPVEAREFFGQLLWQTSLASSDLPAGLRSRNSALQ